MLPLRTTALLRLPLLRFSSTVPSTTVPSQTTLETVAKPSTSVANTHHNPHMPGYLHAAQGETVEVANAAMAMQAPNRMATWSKSQRSREDAMQGPRFEQTVIAGQPAPYAAIELIHQQPVRWTKERIVACDGGGGPNGHPRVFINVDKPQVEPCGYCGLPFAHVKNKEAVIAQGASGYALE